MDSLTSAGVLFVLTHPDKPKVPMNRGWLEHPPTGTQTINHHRDGGGLGIVPWSLQSAVLDCDRGTPDDLIQAHRPYCHYESTTPGRSHLWYRVSKPPQLYLWDYMDCGGEIICSTGHVRLPDPESNLAQLYDSLTRSTSKFQFPPIPPPLPDSLLSPPTPPQVQGQDTGTAAYIYTEQWTGDRDKESPPTLIGKVDTAAVGQRNIALFDSLRFWAYHQPRPADFRTWEWLILERVLELREHLPSLWDFPKREARDTGRSVARWTWENRATAGAVDSERQRKRAYLRAKRARQKAHNRDNEIIHWRDIKRESWRAIGARMAMSPEGVRKAYRRKKGEDG